MVLEVAGQLPVRTQRPMLVLGSADVLVRAGAVVPSPSHLSDAQAATLPCAATTAWSSLEVGSVAAGDVVVTLGTGGVSLFAMQLAKARGATVIATTSSNAKIAI